MTKKKLEQVMGEIKNYRSEIISKLVQFASSDTLLFWCKEDARLAQKQEEMWTPVLKWATDELCTNYSVTSEFAVPEQDRITRKHLQLFMEDLSDKELAAFYLASINMKSELLAAALIKGQINAEQAFNAAYLEELWQAERWGKDDISEANRKALKNELSDIECFLRK